MSWFPFMDSGQCERSAFAGSTSWLARPSRYSDAVSLIGFSPIFAQCLGRGGPARCAVALSVHSVHHTAAFFLYCAASPCIRLRTCVRNSEGHAITLQRTLAAKRSRSSQTLGIKL